MRFEFGKNWNDYLSKIDEKLISLAETSLKDMYQEETFEGKKFLDIGSGSGLFSLAAHRLGGEVFSFDFDSISVSCTKKLKDVYFHGDDIWTVESGSILDENYIKSLGKFDFVYSWGVLHHTGNMWKALENVIIPLGHNGKLFISIYNDQGISSKIWHVIKKTYNHGPKVVKIILLLFSFIRLWGPTMLRELFMLRPFFAWRNHNKNRGMDPWTDLKDWVGGYPFEVATPDKIVEFFKERNLKLLKLKTCGNGLGCNEFVFENSKP